MPKLKDEAPGAADGAEALTAVRKLNGVAATERGVASARDDIADTLAAPSGAADTGDGAPSLVQVETGSFGDDTGARYAVRRVLGEGGMGEVRLCRDGRIGREVAMKVARRGAGSHPDARARFLREVRVQGQLEHPSVVPVYDLGHTQEGETFFTMKRVRGRTLEDILAGLAEGDEETIEHYTPRRLLAALAQVSLTVAFAHARGVVHRDLKPANIMLGDFGEVYVLDWGVAKIASSPDLPPEGGEGHAPLELDDAGGANTAAGTVLGTPGYMAPEQVLGDVDGIGPHTDVYALGVILFETLALEPFHRGKSATERMMSALQDGDPLPSSRRPDVPPELDAICERALERDPKRRYSSARALHEELEGYLDGQRDVERRRALVDSHIGRARLALEAAGSDAENPLAHEVTAMRELGSALALDPTDRGAMGMLRAMLLDTSSELPPAAEEELQVVNVRDRARAARVGASVYGVLALLFPGMLTAGVRLTWLAALIEVTTALVAAYFFWMARTGNASPRYMRMAIFGCFTQALLMSTAFGPLVLTPAIITANATIFLAALRPSEQTRHMIAGLSVLTLLLPLALSWLGLIGPWYEFAPGRVTVLPTLLELSPRFTGAVLTSSAFLVIVLANVGVGVATSRLVVAERRLQAQAWRLRQLLPDDASTAPPAPISDMCGGLLARR
jgi:serine/threonine protein kinase